MDQYQNRDPKDSYKFVQAINKEMNIQSKEEYYQHMLEHPKYVANPETYFSTQWISWSDFLGLD
jgi:hypothetical protein